MMFLAQQTPLLVTNLRELREGEGIRTLHFSGARSAAKACDCSYYPMWGSPPTYVFIKGGGLHPDKLLPWIYQGETFAALKAKRKHYIESLIRPDIHNLTYESAFVDWVPRLNELLIRGHNPMMFTDVVQESSVPTLWPRFFHNYLQPFFGECPSDKELIRLLRILANYSGIPFEWTTVLAQCKARGLQKFNTRKKLQCALDTLRMAGVWNELPPVAGIASPKTRPISKKRVGFFFDSGFLRYLLRKGVNTDSSSTQELLFWHIVANDIYREIAVNQPETSIQHYWRAPTNQPVLILKHGERLYPIGISLESWGDYFFRRMDFIPEFKQQPKILVTSDDTPTNRDRSRVTLRYDTVIAEDDT
jgi:hypothetical protein